VQGDYRIINQPVFFQPIETWQNDIPHFVRKEIINLNKDRANTTTVNM